MYYFKNGTVTNNSNVEVKKSGGKITVFNKTEGESVVLFPKIYKKKSNYCRFEFSGKMISGHVTKPPVMKILSEKRASIFGVSLNNVKYTNNIPTDKFMLALHIRGKCEFEIDAMDVRQEVVDTEVLDNHFKGNVLVLSPGYPSDENRYMCGFVHTRVNEYKKLSWNVDVAAINDFSETSIYSFEGVEVVNATFGFLRELLWRKKYDRILVHFFNEKFANVFDKIHLNETKLYFYLHGAETLYRDWDKITSSYFMPPEKITTDLLELFEKKDEVIKRYNDRPNVTWFFVTPWTQRRSEELIGIKYKNAKILPCLIDADTFVYRDHDPELRKKIFVLRKFDNPFTYALDIDVHIVHELSRRPFFKDLEFDFYGDGPLFEVITNPLRKYPNVHLHRGFLNHKEISEVHRTHGIALFPTRFDSQAVSSCEAACSGCAVVSTKNPGVEQEIYPKYNTLCNQENYKEYADVIERLYYDPDEFKAIGKGMAEDIRAIYGYDNAIQRELDFFKEDDKKGIEPLRVFKPALESPVLTVIIPAYNVEKYLEHTVWSLVDHENAHKLEIIIINDGSKDKTSEIGKMLEKLTATENGSIVRLIDKENGGHGSVLNVGVELARGKYLKIIDGDDTVVSKKFSELVEILENCDSDVVLNNYIEDQAATNLSIPHREYEFLIPGIEYHFDDLCFDGYGFNDWGPLLSTSTYKVEMLRRRAFKTTEKMLYDDMEWNVNVAANIDTLVYYPLDIYNYLIGREGQSVSPQVLSRKFPIHRKMVLSIINLFNTIPNLSVEKRSFLEHKIIVKMILTHYQLVTTELHSRKGFCDFDKELKAHPYFYKHPSIVGTKINFHRMTRGMFMFIEKYEHQLRRILGRA
ncbi:MAG: glycosyltransferase [Ruminococcaceae bacterium]|nr:glycosyltransferase [Oscillospiraceae bacterium]